MKHVIYPEKQGTPTVDSDAGGTYAITNLTADDSRKKVWKAIDGVQTATIRLPISANAEVISLHKTNAETAICSITLDSGEVQLTDGQPAVNLGGGLVKIPSAGHGLSQGDIALIYGTTNYDGVHTMPSQAAGDGTNFVITATYVAETFAAADTVCQVVESTTHTLEGTRTYDRLWQEYTEQVAAHTATIKLTAATGETIEAGIVRAGDMLTLRNPRRGVGEQPFDYSEVEILHNGADYVVDGDVVREFSYSMDLTRDTEFRDLMDLYTHYKKNPFAMLIADSLGDDNMYCVFGKLLSPPSGSHEYTEVPTNVSIREVV